MSHRRVGRRGSTDGLKVNSSGHSTSDTRTWCMYLDFLCLMFHFCCCKIVNSFVHTEVHIAIKTCSLSTQLAQSKELVKGPPRRLTRNFNITSWFSPQTGVRVYETVLLGMIVVVLLVGRVRTVVVVVVAVVVVVVVVEVLAAQQQQEAKIIW